MLDQTYYSLQSQSTLLGTPVQLHLHTAAQIANHVTAPKYKSSVSLCTVCAGVSNSGTWLKGGQYGLL